MKIKITTEKIGDVTVVHEFWECNCKTRFIRSKRNGYCIYCNTHMEDAPDARLYDVLAYFGSLPDLMIKALRETEYTTTGYFIPCYPLWDSWILQYAIEEGYVDHVHIPGGHGRSAGDNFYLGKKAMGILPDNVIKCLCEG